MHKMAAAAESSLPDADAAPAKVSRYRSVRRAQAQQQQLSEIQHSIPPVPAIPPIPSMEAIDATVSRSMSRYHRRPTTSQAQSPIQKNPPVQPNIEIVPPLVPNSAHTASSSARNRALSSPHHTSRVANNVSQRSLGTSRPQTSRSRPEVVPLLAQDAREPPQGAREEAKQLLQAEAERHKRLHEKQKAGKRAILEAEQAHKNKEEKLRGEEEAEAQRLNVQREADEAEQVRRQKEEQERGKRLQKAESAAHLNKREEEARKGQSLPPTSPPRQGGGFGIFTRKRRETAPSAPDANIGRPRQTSNGNNRDLDTIKPGGGGAVLGIDAPISAVNAGDRVRWSCVLDMGHTNPLPSVSWWCAIINTFTFLLHPQRLP
jgi:hypothetical protein